MFNLWKKSTKQTPNYCSFVKNLSQCQPPDRQFMEAVCKMVLKHHGSSNARPANSNLHHSSGRRERVSFNRYFDELDLANIERDKRIDSLQAIVKKLQRDLDLESMRRKALDRKVSKLVKMLGRETVPCSDKLSCSETDISSQEDDTHVCPYLSGDSSAESDISVPNVCSQHAAQLDTDDEILLSISHS